MPCARLANSLAGCLRLARDVQAKEDALENDKGIALLKEIRDSQREHLDEYRRVANEALAIQRQAFEIQQNAVTQQKGAVDAQASHLRLYRKVLVVAAVIVAAAIWFVSTYG